MRKFNLNFDSDSDSDNLSDEQNSEAENKFQQFKLNDLSTSDAEIDDLYNDDDSNDNDNNNHDNDEHYNDKNDKTKSTNEKDKKKEEEILEEQKTIKAEDGKKSKVINVNTDIDVHIDDLLDSEKSYDKKKKLVKKKHKRSVNIVDVDKVLADFGWVTEKCSHCGIIFNDIDSEYFYCECKKIFCGICVDKCKFKVFMNDKFDWYNGKNIELEFYQVGHGQMAKCGYCNEDKEKFRFLTGEEAFIRGLTDKNYQKINKHIGDLSYEGLFRDNKVVMKKIINLDPERLEGSSLLIYNVCKTLLSHEEYIKFEIKYQSSVEKIKSTNETKTKIINKFMEEFQCNM